MYRRDSLRATATDRGELLIVDEVQQLPACSKSTCAVKKVALLTLSAPPAMQQRQRRRQRGSGHAISDPRIHRFDIETLAHMVDGIDLGAHVIVPDTSFMLASADFQLTMNTVTPCATAQRTKLFFSFRSRI